MRTVNAPVLNVPFFLRRITPKFVTEAVLSADPKHSVGINLLALARPVEARHLYDLYGTIRFATIVPDKSGTKKDSVRFSGKMKAYTRENEAGEQYIFESGQAFIPVMEEYMYTALKDAQAIDAGAYLEVAFAIGIRPADPTKPSMTGYEWEVQKLITQQPTKDDPIERLRAEAKAQQLALAAPRKETKAEQASNANPINGEAAAPSSSSAISSEPPVDPAPKHGKNRHSQAT